MTLQNALDPLFDPISGKPLSKRKVRELLYKEGFNVIAEVDKQLCEIMFHPGTPFRILPSSEVIDGADRNIATLVRTVDVYNYLCDQPDADIRNLIEKMRSFDINDIFERREEWKSLNKQYRDVNISLSKQLALSFCRSFYVSPTVEVSSLFLEDYINQYGNDFPCTKYQPDWEDEQIAAQFAAYYNIIFKDMDPIIHTPKASKNKASSMSRRKYYDWKYLLTELGRISDIDPDAKRAILLCLNAIQMIYHLNIQDTIDLVKSIPENSDSINLLEFLPNGNMVAQRKGKVGRFVCAGNDIYDLALQPLMTVIQRFESVLPCFAPNKLKHMSNADLNHAVSTSWKDISIQLSYNESLSFNSTCCGADSSNATEKLNGSYMFESWKIDYDMLDEEIKNKFGLTEEYISICEKLLTETPFHIFNKNEDWLMYTNGTSQGLMVSWDCLNYGNMKVIARSFYDLGIDEGFKPWLCSRLAFKGTMKSSTDGDDALFPLDIRPYYVNRLQELSLPGVINEDKSHDENEIGYVEYISSYVKSGSYSPVILSNLMIISLITDLTDGFKIRALYASKFMKYQLMMLKDVLDKFEILYNRRNLPYLLNSPDIIERSIDFSVAADRIRYMNLCDSLKRIDHHDLVAKEGTDYAPCKELAPCNRALNISINNMSMSYSQAYIIASEKALAQCYDCNSIIGELDEELLEIKELINEGLTLDEIDTNLTDRDQDILRASMAHSGISMDTIFYVDKEVLEKNFEVQYNGFTGDFLISCKMKTIKEV